MEQKNNSGIAFKNLKKEGNQPDFRGNALVDGVDKEISAWAKTDKKGNPYFTLSFKDKEPQPQSETKGGYWDDYIGK